MTNFPITPPPDLIHNWCQELRVNGDRVDLLLVKAAQWGADMELEACCEWLVANQRSIIEPALRAARRPKPPSLKDLKEQALEDLEILIADLANHGMGFKATTIRRALEQLDD